MTTISNLKARTIEQSINRGESVYYNLCYSAKKIKEERIFVETDTLKNNEPLFTYQFNLSSVQTVNNLGLDSTSSKPPDSIESSIDDHSKIVWVKQPVDFIDRFKVDIIIQLTNLIILLL